MKKFFIKLDKNFTNLIIIFISSLIASFILTKYHVSFIDILIYNLSFVLYLKFIDKLFLSFRNED